MSTRQMLSRGDGENMTLTVETWQHDPYTVHIPCTEGQHTRATAFQAASNPVIRQDGLVYATAHEPLRWGRYSAVVHLYAAAPGTCPHC